jgi:hypothetical protein
VEYLVISSDCHLPSDRDIGAEGSDLETGASMP